MSLKNWAILRWNLLSNPWRRDLLEANSRWRRNAFIYYGFNNSLLTEQVGWISKSCDLYFCSKLVQNADYSARGFLLFPSFRTKKCKDSALNYYNLIKWEAAWFGRYLPTFQKNFRSNFSFLEIKTADFLDSSANVYYSIWCHNTVTPNLNVYCGQNLCSPCALLIIMSWKCMGNSKQKFSNS